MAEALRRAVAHYRQGDIARADSICKAILKAEPDCFDALHLSALVEAQRGRLDEADRLLSRALKANPNAAEAHANRGNVALARGQFEKALASFDHALSINPGAAGVFNNRGTALSALKRHDDALASYDRALAIQPAFAEALNSRGATLSALRRYEEALANFEQALAIKPGMLEALNNRSGALKELQRFDEALESYDRALALKPDFAAAHYNRGVVLSALKRQADALASYDRALALKPDFPEALNNRAAALAALKQHDEAIASWERALAMRPDFADALVNRGAALSYLGRHEAAIDDFRRALKLDGGLPFAAGALLHARMQCCEWATYEEDARSIIAAVQAGERAAEPFVFLGVSNAPRDQLRCAEVWVREHCPRSPEPLWSGQRYAHDRIRLAYVSSNFHEHPMGHLMAGLFERHDRERFETIAVSYGPDDSSAMRARLEGAFDRFIDVRQRSDREIAQLVHEMEADIAVDGSGYMTDSRPGILALRPAPIQVNYLAHPGTMGADYIDYLIADRTVVPVAHRDWYAEQLVYLPDSYQVNDAARRIAQHTPSRAEVGLPDRAFVFCSFNNNYKITPEVFAVWTRLLRDTPDSVLWLLQGNRAAQRNLRREAARRGIAADRLVFAPRVKAEDHLARQRLADLFLDTLPCNAHTTASDALWAGLPVVTCIGTTFAGRVAASLLHAVGLPELITTSLRDYESLALELASDRSRLTAIRRKLAAQRDGCTLFDTDRFRRQIEAAFVRMWERCQRGEPPASFAVDP